MSRLQRYVSDELTHLVGRSALNDLESQYTTFLKIIRSGLLTHSPDNPSRDGPLLVSLNARISNNEMYEPKMVCFCDIPVEDLGLHASKYGSFGLAFKKCFLTAQGANPVFYIAYNSTVEVLGDLKEIGLRFKDLSTKRGVLKKTRRADHFDEMLLAFHEVSQIRTQQGFSTPSGWSERSWRVDQFLTFEIFSYLKVFKEIKSDDDPENYYMEREWRVLGNVRFSVDDISRVILPELFAKRFRADVRDYFNQVTFI